MQSALEFFATSVILCALTFTVSWQERGQAVKQSAEMQSALEFFATSVILCALTFTVSWQERGQAVKQCRALVGILRNFSHSVTFTVSWQERGQAVKQSAEMQSALEFFATSVILCALTFECVNSSSRSSEKHVHLVFAKEALENPNTSRQSRASHGDE